jgi:hypothetical protein
MNAILSILTAAALFIHAAMGCCWHHTHHCGHGDATTAGVSQPVQCCKHHHPAQHGKQPADPCKCKVECHGVCIYLPTQKTHIDAPRIVIPFNHVAVIPALADTHHLSAPFRLDGTGGALESEPPLRLHLLHQILLI